MEVGRMNNNGNGQISQDVITKGVYQSFSNPLATFGYTAHSLLVPPFAPKNMLILGYGGGNIAALTKRIWGEEVKIDGIENNEDGVNLNYDDNVLIYDAESFVRSCQKQYDYVCVDLYDGKVIPEFVLSPEFILNLARISKKLLGINCTFHNFKEFEVYQKYFLTDCLKVVNDDKALFWINRNIFKQH